MRKNQIGIGCIQNVFQCNEYICDRLQEPRLFKIESKVSSGLLITVISRAWHF